MRVLHVITRLIVGGAQENTISSVLGLRQKPGLSVKLITGRTNKAEGSLEPPLSAVPDLLEIIPELVRPIHLRNDIITLRKLTGVFRAERPHIVHTHSSKAGVLGRVAAARANVPIIIHTIHGPAFGSFQGPLANILFRAAEKYAARVTTHFVVVAEAMKQQYLAAGIGTPEQYTTVLSGFDLTAFLNAKNDMDFRARFGFGADDIVIGKISRLFKLKGHKDLFEIAANLMERSSKIKFLLVGGGEWQSRFEQQVRKQGLSKHFVFTGIVPPSEVPRFVGIMDILVHLSSREGLPRALPQAMAAAKPVVAYDCDGAREVCLDRQTGFLIKPGALDLLTDRLLQLANDVQLRDMFGKAGQKFVRERFDVSLMVDRLYDLYLQLARRTPNLFFS